MTTAPPHIVLDDTATVAADRIRAGTAEHLAALPGITVRELDPSAVLAVARETSCGPGPHPVRGRVAQCWSCCSEPWGASMLGRG
ncbi:hypothetical protein B9W64_26445 [Streptomyces sp. CS159]|nr:hypothetical protein B9W64_26445 [Streptomyces sp. CS159]